MPRDLHKHPLYEGVTSERARLRDLEAKFSRSIDNGSIDLTVIREYAAAVHSYTQAAMSWLSWVETATLQASKTDKTAGA